MSGAGRLRNGIEVGQAFAEVFVGAKEEGLNRRDGAVHGTRHLGIIELLVFVHQHGRAMVRRKLLYSGANFRQSHIVQEELFHVGRARLGLAQSRLGWRMIPWPTDYHTVPTAFSSDSWFYIGDNLRMADEAVHEWIGLAAYGATRLGH